MQRVRPNNATFLSLKFQPIKLQKKNLKKKNTNSNLSSLPSIHGTPQSASSKSQIHFESPIRNPTATTSTPGLSFKESLSRSPQSHWDPPPIPFSNQGSILMFLLPSATQMNCGFRFPEPGIECRY